LAGRRRARRRIMPELEATAPPIPFWFYRVVAGAAEPWGQLRRRRACMIGQEIGGHISPLAAYDAKADRFLILDVARHKYPPVWVKAAELFDAMNTPDAANDNRTRGYVLVAKPDAAQ
jgi:hypothetical protein